MHVIVGGCGRLGAEIAEQLSNDPQHDVVVIDWEPPAFARLGAGFNGETLEGDVTDRDVLEAAGIARADAFLAVTRFDNANLMAVEIADHLYGVEHTIARLFNPEREEVYRRLGVRYVSGTGILAKLFLNELREEEPALHVHFPHGDVEVVDIEVDERGRGRTVAELEEAGGIRVAAVRRGHRVFVPAPTERIEQGDVLTAAANPRGRSVLDAISVRSAVRSAARRRG